MNNRLLLALFFVTIIYIGIGGVAFHFLESSSGTKTRLMILDYIKSFRSEYINRVIIERVLVSE